MAMRAPGAGVSAIDRWNQLHYALASQERRMIIYSLMDAPVDSQLSLPEAAMAPDTSLDADRLSIQLHHAHLPMLADAGYIQWQREPFSVQRGPHFDEMETVFELIHDSIDQFPWSLIGGCEVYEQLYEEARK